MPTRARSNGNPLAYSRKLLAGLPAPVARYFEFALTPGQPFITSAHFEQTGTFRRSPTDHWHPFTAVQEVTTAPPSFVWDAKIHMTPLPTAHVRDSYVEGVGAMKGKIGGLLTIVDMHGTPEMASAALLRWLAEAPWYPTALLPREGLVWTPVDATRARVTLSDGATTVSLDVRFGRDGEIASSSAPRCREYENEMVLTPWSGRCTAYRRIEGVMIPTDGEVGWLLPEGEFTYWRGHTDSAMFAFAM